MTLDKRRSLWPLDSLRNIDRVVCHYTAVHRCAVCVRKDDADGGSGLAIGQAVLCPRLGDSGFVHRVLHEMSAGLVTSRNVPVNLLRVVKAMRVAAPALLEAGNLHLSLGRGHRDLLLDDLAF